ncbi:hypothetical protein [Rubidibacter lacunae]|uniref:hypothetical protein n=1 Tax=Rubidibacter lacunae TaxID=582514 RepID=UPI0012EC1AFB|nr:hypothetical protein [Rubidibacter lacunae]
MSKNLFKRWAPLESMPNVMYLEDLHQIHGNSVLRLKGSDEEGDVLGIIFDAALVYKNRDEGDLLFYNRSDGEEDLGRCGFFYH